MGQPATLDQTIRYCGTNKVLMEMSHNGQSRYVEVYSYRVTKTGETLLFAWCHLHNKIESFKVDNIEYAKATNMLFTPRWPIEF